MARPNRLLILILITCLGFALRLHELGSVPLRGDEAFSALNWAGKPLQQSLTEIAAIEPHPPLTYILFRFWRLLIGGIESPFSLRLLPALLNMIGAPALYALGLRLSGKWTGGIAAALLWSIHPYEIWHSQDFRSYAIWAGLSATSLCLGLRLIDRPRPANWLLHALFAIGSALVFYTEVFVSIALVVVAVCWKKRDRRFLMRFLFLQSVVALTALAAILLLQGKLLTSGAYPGNLETLYVPDYLLRFVPALTLGETLPSSLFWLWVVLTPLMLFFAYLVARASRREIQFIAAVILVPMLLLGIVSSRVNIFHPRYVMATAPAFVLLVSLGSLRLTKSLARLTGVRKGVLLPIIWAPWIFLPAVSLDSHFNNLAFRKSPAWDELGGFLKNRVTVNDLVIQLSADAAFEYYYQGPAEDIALPSGPLQPAASIIKKLETIRTDVDSIYVVSNAIESWQNAQVVENWMQENMQAVLLSDASGLAIRQFMEWSITDPGEPPLASFGEAIDLVGFRFDDAPLPTGELLLWVYWRPVAITERSLKSFVHVYGDADPETGSILWSQDDQFPQSGRIDSTSWAPAEVFRDVYYLPAGAMQNGVYELSLGWYDPLSGDRLLVGAGLDNFVLQSFAYPPKR